MPLYRIGSIGEEIKSIQRKLRELGFYRGPVDGIFGGGTEAAVRAFQKSKGLSVDGIVGPVTWNYLFNEDIKENALLSRPLIHRCLALTGSFETGRPVPDCFAGISGDFDGQGMSFGVLQWNFGQNSLQPLLNDMINEHQEVVKEIFHNYFDVLVDALNSDKEDLMTFIRSIQHPVRHYIYEPWRGMFKSLGRTEEFQEIQVRYAERLFNAALSLCNEYELWSERAVALMFDIKVQNGSISRVVKRQIIREIEELSPDLSDEDREVQKMTIIANRRAEASNPRWIEDVRARKLCCAQGHGVVHGIRYDIREQFGIELKPYE